MEWRSPNQKIFVNQPQRQHILPPSKFIFSATPRNWMITPKRLDPQSIENKGTLKENSLSKILFKEAPKTNIFKVCPQQEPTSKDVLIEDIQKGILKASKNLLDPSNIDKIFGYLERSRSKINSVDEDTILDLKYYLIGLNVCEHCKSENDNRNRPDYAFWIYNKIMKHYPQAVTSDAQAKLLEICKMRGNWRMAKSIVNDYLKGQMSTVGQGHGQKIMENLLITLAWAGYALHDPRNIS